MPSDYEPPREGRPVATRRRTRQRTQPEEVHVRVPVAFNQHLSCGDTAFVLVELLRSVLFMRGQLPMPAHELLSALNERERRDNSAARDNAAAAVAAAAAAASAAAAAAATPARASTDSPVSGGDGGDGGDTRGSRTATGGRKSGQRAKSKRPLAKASAHRRARKLVGVLEEISSAVEEAFADASRNGRPVLEALILLGASHLSPREVYSIMFAEPPSGGSSGKDDVRGKSGLAEAYARKLVRSMVGAMSSVNLRGLGACRVHLFLRIADTPVPDLRNLVIPATPTPHTENATSTSRIAKINSSNLATSDRTPIDPSLASGMEFQANLHAARPRGAVARLSPLPGFKIRVSRSRPAPKVSIVISTRPAAPPSATDGTSSCTTRGNREGQLEEPDHSKSHAEDGAGRRSETVQDWRAERRHGQGAAEGKRGLASGGPEEERAKHQQQQQQQRGVWHQLVCARLVGLKGCNSLAG